MNPIMIDEPELSDYPSVYCDCHEIEWLIFSRGNTPSVYDRYFGIEIEHLEYHVEYEDIPGGVLIGD